MSTPSFGSSIGILNNVDVSMSPHMTILTASSCSVPEHPSRAASNHFPGLLRAVAPRYRYCSGATFTVAVAVAPLLLVEKNGDGSAATFSPVFWRYALPLLLSTDN